MASQYKQRRQRQDGQKEQRTSQVELADVYGEQLFTPLEQLVSQLTQKGVQLENGDFVTIKEAAGETVAAEAQRLREIINNSGEQRRDLINWASTAITTSFPEDQQDNAFCLILPGQAKRHQFIVDTLGFMSKYGRDLKVAVESKQNVRAMLVAFDAVAQEVEAKINEKFPDLASPYGAYKASVPEGTPPMTMGEYLKAKADVREKREAAKQELGEAKGKAKWLSNWVEGKPRPGKPGAEAHVDKPKSAIEAKRSEVEALKAKISDIQGDESRMAGLKNYTMAGEYQLEWATLQNKELPRLEAELVALEQAEELKARVEAAAQVVANAPEQATGTFTVGTDADATKVKKDLATQPAGPTTADQMAKLTAEIAIQLVAAKKHEAEALQLRGTVTEAALKDANAAIGILQQVKAESEAAVTARGLAAKWDAELMELKVEADKPKAEAKPAASPVAATAAAQDTSTTDDPITTLEAILEDMDDAELTKAAAGLLDAVKLATEKGKGGKRIKTALVRFRSEEVDVEAVIADTEALLAIAK